MLIRLPEVIPFVATPELSISLLEDEDDLDESVAEILTSEEPVSQPTVEVTAEKTTVAEIVSREPVDWNAEISIVVSDMSLPPSEPAAFNVGQMEKRRRAAEKFAPIPSHEPVPIWNNVARDMTGRSVLVHGDCERVINDPNAGSREAFEVFGQYIVTCKKYDKKPQLLAWVDEINSRREAPSRYGHPTAE